MQFHLDYSKDSIQTMIDHCSAELIADTYVQTDPEVLTDTHRALSLERRLFSVMDYFSRT
jgi:hypothetical protein